MSDQEFQEFLTTNKWGRLATASIAAEPHVTPIGYVYCRDAIYFSSLRKSRRGRNLQENSKASLLVDDGVGSDDDYTKRRGVIIYGNCTMLPDDAPELTEVRKEFARVMGAKNEGELERKTHSWYRLDIKTKASWDFGKIPIGADQSVDRIAKANENGE